MHTDPRERLHSCNPNEIFCHTVFKNGNKKYASPSIPKKKFDLRFTELKQLIFHSHAYIQVFYARQIFSNITKQHIKFIK